MSYSNTAAAVPAREMLQIPKHQIAADPHQPRQHFDATDLALLQHAIETEGQTSPVLVRRNDMGGFLIVNGERRWRAICQSSKIHGVLAQLYDGPTDRPTVAHLCAVRR